MFKKILIANRGEIACRIICTAKRLGVYTAVIHSSAEQNALHVKLADEAIEIQASTPRASYLDIENIIKAAKQIGAQAIHPGYGFLSENSDFALACEQAGIVFIGPSPRALELMGEKDKAKRIAQEIGVPIINGYMGEEQSEQAFATAAEKIGFPLLIKAVAGGGGKAQHIVNSNEELITLLPTAHREAQQSFANSQLLLEKYLPNARHIEVQIFGDSHGHYVHLFDRDCSLQRRYQKVLEEAMAANLTEKVRVKLWQDALKLAKHINYAGAGTVEFLVAGDEYYFLEMNTRLQVEHPVTEAITNTDLVEWQLRIAAGESLPMAQNDIKAQGHAIEVRICAEDPEHDFFPSTGKIEKIIFPADARVESGIQENDSVTPHFDSLLAKLIVRGDTRHQAFYQLQQALAQTLIVGVTSNLALLQRVVNQSQIGDVVFSTHWLEHHPELYHVQDKELDYLVYAAAYKYLQLQKSSNSSPWEQLDGWRMNLPAEMNFYFGFNNQTYRVSLKQRQQRGQVLTFDIGLSKLTREDYHQCQMSRLDPFVILGLNILPGKNQDEYFIYYQDHEKHHEQHFRAYLSSNQLHLVTTTDRAVVTISPLLVENNISKDLAPGLQAPMPGAIVQVFVDENQVVSPGDRLLTLEAMKMEYTIRAPHAGKVKKLYYKKGDVVNAGVTLVDIEES